MNDRNALARFFFLFCFCCLGACQVAPEAGYTLDSADLSQWRVVGQQPWVFHEGALTVAKPDGDTMLVSRQRYADFRLTLDFWVDERVNSGVLIRCSDEDTVSPLNCYELNIWDKHPKQAMRTGAIVLHHMPPLAHVDTIGKWNQLDVIAKGNYIKLRINGRVTAEIFDTKHAVGTIALQRFVAGDVRFKNIRVTPL